MRVHGGTAPRVIPAAAAAELVSDGATLAVAATGGGINEPSVLIGALHERFAESGTPRGITLFHSSGLGDRAGAGADRLTAPGLVRRVIAGHLGMSPRMAARAQAGEVEGYNLPQGVMSQLYREIAGGRPGVITRAGLGTFVDPRRRGGRVGDHGGEDLVEVIELAGEEWLLYRSLPIDVLFLRGTAADTRGNLTLTEEGSRLDLTSAAMATRNSGGTVIAQALRIVSAGELPARDVVVPGHLIDYLVEAPGQWQTAASRYNPSFSGEERVATAAGGELPRDARTMAARRTLAELRPGSVVNLGIGVPASVAAVAAAEGRLDDFTLTIEQGAVGGMPAGGIEFGVAWNPEAIIDQHLQFDFYDGGGLDATCLGFAQVDRHGNVNVSRVGGRVFGVGGFVNISRAARKVVFCGTFTSRGLEVETGEGSVRIVTEGRHRKFVEQVDEVTFDGSRALAAGREVLCVTERAVLRLTAAGWELAEVAPGVDLGREVLGLMDFAPVIPEQVSPMDLG